MLVRDLEKCPCEVITLAESRADDPEAVSLELDASMPDRVICCIGRTHGPGVPNIDYLEDKPDINIRDNFFAPQVLAKLCENRGIHMTYIGTGCIFDSRDNYKKTYTEDDLPDFKGSAYSLVKGY